MSCTQTVRYVAGALVAILPLAAGTSEEQTPAQRRPISEQGYIGLSFRDHKASRACLVHWVLPGPLRGPAGAAAQVSRGDLILAADGKPVTSEELRKLVRNCAPGQPLTLTLRRTQADPDANPLVPGPGQKEEELKVVLASRADWTGPLTRDRPATRPLKPTAVLPEHPPDRLEKFIREETKSRKLDAGVAKLLEALHPKDEDDGGFHLLNRALCPLYEPFRLRELQEMITRPLPALTRDPGQALLAAADNLDVARPAAAAGVDISKPGPALEAAARCVQEASARLDEAFARLDAATRARLPRDLAELVKWLAEKHDLAEHPDLPRMLRTLNAGVEVDYEKLLAAAGALAGFLRVTGRAPPDGPAAPLPAELQGAVSGPILAALHKDGRWFVYGGREANTYDLSRVAVVMDAGGNDTYRSPAGAHQPIQLVVDLAGDDRHETLAAGPAAGIAGVSFLVDYGGDDLYQSPGCGCGAGVLGVGVLLDAGGNDQYLSRYWSQGAGLYGAGVLLDLGGGGDMYHSEVMSQGIGGPRGFGLLLDGGGCDLYRANGPQRSVYGTPAVFYACSQGVGYGLRPYDSGGIGVLEDLGGDDRYEAGEFAQGGGYCLGLGILHDRAGSDSYVGTRYAQGWGAHSAAGVLCDEGGDDTYYALQLAAQGAAWDYSVGLLLDRAGSDSYQAGSLCQGSAAMQAVGWLIDLAGQDRYVSAGPGAQGQSGANFYHYEETGAFSFSLLLDAGGAEDFYSTGRKNNKTLATGALDALRPENSDLYGLFIDTRKGDEF
jgi:hypothetical protein